MNNWSGNQQVLEKMLEHCKGKKRFVWYKIQDLMFKIFQNIFFANSLQVYWKDDQVNQTFRDLRKEK